MIIAIIIGIVAGLLAIVPFYFAAKNAKKIDPTAGSFSMLGPFLLTIVVSFAILVCVLALGKTISPNNIVPLAVSEFVAFVIGVIVLGVLFAKGRKPPASSRVRNATSPAPSNARKAKKASATKQNAHNTSAQVANKANPNASAQEEKNDKVKHTKE